MNFRFFSRIFLFIFILCLCSGCRATKNEKLRAKQGVIDLSVINLKNSEPVCLDGEWEFYWKQLLTPQDFKGGRPSITPAYMALPAAWNSTVIDGLKLGGAGYATFRLLILPGKGKQDLILRLGELNSAYRLWVNGNLLVENGLVGTNAIQEIPAQSVKLPRLHLEGQPVQLLLQVSNFHHRAGGVIAPLRLGISDTLEVEQFKQWALALLCVGSLIVMGCYHVGLYWIRRGDRAPLYFGVYSLLWAASSLTSGTTDWAINLFVSDYPTRFVNRVDLICFVMTLPVGYSFFRTLYPGCFPHYFQQITTVVALIFTGVGLLFSSMTFTSMLPVLYLFSVFLIVYCLYLLFCAMRAKMEAAGLILSGFLVMGAAGINDMLCDLQIIRSIYMIHVGMFVFIFFQAIALSIRFSRAFHAVEHLSNELSDKNLVLEEEMSERIRLESEREEARAEAIRASQLAALGELAAGVAHEINTPVNTIINSADLLLEDDDRASLEHDVEVIKKQGRRIAAIVKNLLFFSRLPSKDMIPFCVADMLQGTLDMIGARLRKEHVCLKIVLPPDLPNVLVRPQQIEQIFLNFITNAVHAVAERYDDTADCKLIEIRALATVVNKRPFVRITFRDNGAGIPAHLLACVKNSFVTTKQSGTGLGLSICQQIIDEHGGSMRLESKVGEYTEVQIELPSIIPAGVSQS